MQAVNPLSASSYGPDIRVPFELWEMIFFELYPSQLARLSCTSKAMTQMIKSFQVWRRLTQRCLLTGRSYRLKQCQSIRKIVRKIVARSLLDPANIVGAHAGAGTTVAAPQIFKRFLYGVLQDHNTSEICLRMGYDLGD
ncbi:hypothetical protein BGZ83_010560 [Gryganskiella cystojenkinii]|nr:hypothetical protein BGZ83_010560 [Gryganskiella cystojenkinii]